MDHHLGSPAEEESGNHRNGDGRKTVTTDSAKWELSIRRDRHGRYDPVLIGKYPRRFAGFDEKFIALYARGMSTRDVAGPGERSYRFSARGGGGVTEPGLDATYAVVFKWYLCLY